MRDQFCFSIGKLFVAFRFAGRWYRRECPADLDMRFLKTGLACSWGIGKFWGILSLCLANEKKEQP